MNYLVHHGIAGQKWGVRNGPPYPLKGGTVTSGPDDTAKYKKTIRPNTVQNKKHFDKELPRGTVIQTLSHDKNRTKSADFYYASYKKLDSRQYEAFLNTPASDTGLLKFRISNKAKNNVKVASEDSSIKIFDKLYRNDRDFYNYITDKSRMQSRFNSDWSGIVKMLSYKEYSEALAALDRSRKNKEVSYNDLTKIYRLYNYTLPNMDKDTSRQREKFFKEVKSNGYGAILDTNDGLYNRVQATSPIIVVDPEEFMFSGAERTTLADKTFGSFVLVGRKALKL